MVLSKENGHTLCRLHSEDTMDAMIANELSTMSLQEREHCYHDIHGVSDIIEETPEFVEEKLAKLVHEIAKISGKKKDAYLQAVAQEKGYATNKRFCLKFLRAELFNEKAAAERLVSFFEEKLKIFKPELLAKDIKISDFDEDARNLLESGFAQLVPERDRAGRCVLAWMMPKKPEATCNEQIAMNKCRVLYYLLMAASEDEETQKKGMVAVVISDSRNRSLNLETAMRVPALSEGLPTRWTGVHFCVDKNHVTSKVVSVFTVLAGSRMRGRFRKHVGSNLEIRYELMTFGISMGMFPLTIDGKEFALDNHRKWITQRLKLDSMDSPMIDERVLVPGPMDVLMGREWAAQLHPGNTRFRNTIAELWEAYEGASKREKTQIAQEIVQEINTLGGRFLKVDVAVGYVLVNDSDARLKVSSAFRDRRRTLLVRAEATRKSVYVKAERRDLAAAKKGDDFVQSKRTKRGF